MFCYTKFVEEKYKQYLKYKEHSFYTVVNTSIVFLGEKRFLTPVCTFINENGELIYVPAFNLILGETKEDIENLLIKFANEVNNPT